MQLGMSSNGTQTQLGKMCYSFTCLCTRDV